MYFLKAPREIGEPDRRHCNVTAGHAVSADLSHWTLAVDAMALAAAPAFDDLGTWTRSVVRGPGDQWFMFYTGSGAREAKACAVRRARQEHPPHEKPLNRPASRRCPPVPALRKGRSSEPPAPGPVLARRHCLASLFRSKIGFGW